ncbi:hypothetical protein B9P78_00580 [Aerococcus sp. 1KP-2016]|nr:hypothetical protein B9P78_00580 [Aerococcus sp. 1KP-2016]
MEKIMSKNKLKQFIGIMFLTVIAFFGIAGNNSAVQATSEANFMTTVNIHKIETSATPKDLTADELENGISDLTEWFGEGAKPLQGVQFYIYSVTQQQYQNMTAASASYDTEEEVEAYVGAEATRVSTDATDGEGVTSVDLGEGYYWVIEQPLTTVASSTAVPFGLTLPYTNSVGTANLETINVYPKNTLEATPTVSKALDPETTIEGSQYIGQEFAWTVTSDVPNGIEEYTKYKFTDVLDQALDYVRVDMVSPQGLTKDVDYTVSYNNHTVTVEFTLTGIGKLEDTDIIEFDVVTKMNNKAVPGTSIKNNVTLTYETPHTDGPVDEPNEEEPEVFTGGHDFKKTIDTTDGEGLAKAEFVIQNSKGEYIIQDATTKAVTFTGSIDDATRFISGVDGTFAVDGLAFGDYTLVETKAPSGYALPTNPDTAFTVTKTSHTEVATIVNKAITIPQTGGMGTILFTVVGLALMIFAVVYYKKTNQA